MAKGATIFYKVLFIPFGEADKPGKLLTGNTLYCLMKALELHKANKYDVIIVSGGRNNAAWLMRTWLWEKKVSPDILKPEEKSSDLFDSVNFGMALVDQIMNPYKNAKATITFVSDGWSNRCIRLMMQGRKEQVNYEKHSNDVSWKRIFHMIAFFFVALFNSKGEGIIAGFIRSVFD